MKTRWRRLIQALKEAWRPPCIGCGGDSQVCCECAKETNPRHFPLANARLCLSCDAVFESTHAACPACGDNHWRPVGFFYQDNQRGQKARDGMRNNFKVLRGEKK